MNNIDTTTISVKRFLELIEKENTLNGIVINDKTLITYIYKDGDFTGFKFLNSTKATNTIMLEIKELKDRLNESNRLLNESNRRLEIAKLEIANCKLAIKEENRLSWYKKLFK